MRQKPVQRGVDERSGRARLSLPDRRRIASGLARGLGPAAIARTIGRPTSTVARELSRGSGPAGYQAGEAQRAADQRARRRRSVPASIPGSGYADPPARRTESLTPAARPHRSRHHQLVAELEADLLAAMIERGLPRSAARVMAHLQVDRLGQAGARELASALGLSAGSVSGAVRYLIGQGLISRHRIGRRDLYVVDDSSWAHTWEAALRANARWAEVCRRGADLLGEDSPQGARLATTWRFFARLERALRSATPAPG